MVAVVFISAISRVRLVTIYRARFSAVALADPGARPVRRGGDRDVEVGP